MSDFVPITASPPSGAVPIGVDANITMPDGNSANVQFMEFYRQRVQTAYQTPTITATSYTSGVAVGTVMTFTGCASRTGGSGVVRNFTIVDFDNQQNLSLVLFNANPTAVTDHTTWAPSLADLELVIGIGGSVGAWKGFGTIPIGIYCDNATGTAAQSTIPYVCSGGTSLYGLMLATSTNNYSTTSSLHVSLVVDLD